MKKNSMRLLGFLLMAVMMVSLFAVGVFAEGTVNDVNETASQTSETLTWKDGDVIDGITISKDVTINVSGTVTVNGTIRLDPNAICNVVFNGSENAKLIRGEGFTGQMFYAEGTSANFQKLTFNNITLDGGAVWTGDVDKTLNRGTTNSGVKATGSVLYLVYANATLENDSVLQNHDDSTGEKANAVFLRYYSTFTVNDSIVRNNNSISTYYRGGVVTIRQGGTVKTNNANVYGNSGPSGGFVGISSTGAFGGIVEVKDSKFHNNYAGNGAVFLMQCNSKIGYLSIDGCEFYENASNSAVLTEWAYSRPFIIKDSYFHDNECAVWDCNADPVLDLSGKIVVEEDADYTKYLFETPLVLSGALAEGSSIAISEASLAQLMKAGNIVTGTVDYTVTEADLAKFVFPEGYEKYLVDVNGDGIGDAVAVKSDDNYTEVTITLKDGNNEATATVYSGIECLPANPFPHDGLTFAGWEDADGNAVAKQMFTETTTLYATWTVTAPVVKLSREDATLKATVTNASDAITYTYQWYMDNVAIEGATSATYTMTDVNSHSYKCVVTASVAGLDSVTGSASGTSSAPAVAQVGDVKYATLMEAINAANAAENGATVTLMMDVILDQKLTISGNVAIKGEHTITRADNYTGTLFVINAGATLTLDGGLTIDGNNNYAFDADAFKADADNWNQSISKEDSAKWFTPEAGKPVASAFMFTTTGGTINLLDVTVQNNYSVGSGVISAGANSTILMEGATIKHIAATQGNGVVANVSGANINVTVNEGTVIDGNHTGGNHGLFKIYSGAKLTMNGGEITNNTGWNSNGVIVGVYWGTFVLNGGKICSNTGVYGPSNGRNAVIYLHSGHNFEMNGGTICHNSGRARGGIDAPYDNGKAVINGGSVLDNISRGNGATPDVLGTSGMTINGGTFTQNVSDWLAPDTGLVYDEENGVYTTTAAIWEMHLTDANGEAHWLSPLTGSTLADVLEISKIWYDSLQGGYSFTLKLLTNVTVDETGIVNFPLTIDLNGYTLTGKNIYPVIRVQDGATVTVTGNGSIVNATDYVFVLGSSDQTTAGYLTIENGTFSGQVTIASVTKGTLTINGGNFECTASEYGADYLLNCVDVNYKNGTAQIVVKGGTFVGFDPMNNAAEGAGTNFCSDGHIAEELTEGYFTVRKANYVAEVNGVKYESLQAAINACTNGETVKLIADITYTNEDIRNAVGGATGFGQYPNPCIIDIGGKAGENGAANVPSSVNAILDLNGHTITSTADAYLFMIMDNAKLTFTDSSDAQTGKVITTADAPVIWVIGTETLVTVEGGFYQTASATGLIHVTHGGDLVVNGGEFKTTADDASLLIMLNTKDRQNAKFFISGKATVTIKGGTFHGFNPAKVGDDNGATSIEDIKFVNGCAEGFAPKANADGSYGVVKALAEVNGEYYASLAEALAAAQNGDEIVILQAGTYAVPTGKNITITGAVDGVAFDMSKAVGVNASMTFNNVTFNYGNANYKGLQHAGTMEYNNCTINGQVFLYGTSETFNGCTFNQTSAGAYNVWTYGAKEVAFNECTFNSAGKSVLIYAESASITNDVTFTGCTLNASAPADGKAAIEMDSSLTSGIKLTITDSTATGFANGNVSGNSLWNNKKGNNTDANNDITVIVDGDTVLAPVTFVTKINGIGYTSLADALAAVKDQKDIVIDLLADATLDITAWQTLAIGGDTTKTITINGNGNTLTFNKLNSDWNHVATNNGAILILNDMTITDSGKNTGPWNRYDINFGCNVVLNKVTSTKALAFKANAQLTDVTINESGDNYAIWIQANGQKVTIDGLTVNSAGRGIKIDEQYVDAAKVALSVEDATFTTAKKAAILVKSAAGADIALNNVNIAGVAADTVNAVWVDADAAQYFGLVTVTGGTKAQEDLADFTVSLSVNGEIMGYYTSLQAAINACVAGDNTITLLTDSSEDVTVKQTEDVNVTIDGAGKTYSGTITIHGNARYEGAETLTIRNFNFVTDEASHYFIDSNSTGSTERYAHNVTVDNCSFLAKGAAVDSAVGVRIRQGFNINLTGNESHALHSLFQGYGCTGFTSVGNRIMSGKNGIAVGTSTGVKISDTTIFVKGYGIRADGSGAYDMTVEVCNIGAEMPVVIRYATGAYKLTIDGKSALGVLVEGGYQITFTNGDDGTYVEPTGEYKLITNSYYRVYPDSDYVASIGDEKYFSLADAIAAAQADQTITFLANITEDVTINKNVTIDGAGKTYTGKMTLTSNKGTVTIKNVNFDGKGYNGYAVETRGVYYVTIENCTAKNYGYGFVQLASATVLTTVKNVTVTNVNYGVKVDYSNAVVLENVDITAVTAVYNSNYGKKTITIKDSYLSSLVTWKRNETTKTTYVFEGENTVGEFITNEALDSFKLADVDSTLTAPEGQTVTIDKAGYSVKYVDGTYTAKKVTVTISSVEDLLAFAAAVTGKTEYQGVQVAANPEAIVLLTADLDLTDSGFVGIGNGAANAFSGTFDGQGHTISNMTLSCNYYRGVGFFRSLGKGAVIKNLTFDNANVNNGAATGANHYYGVVAGFANTVTLDNVDVKNSSVTCKYAGAALIGCIEFTNVIKNCDVQNVTLKTNDIRGSVFGILGNSVSGHTVNLENNTVTDFTFIVNNELKAAKLNLVYKEWSAGTDYATSTYVAQIGETKYSTLANAIAAAKDGDTITLIGDVTRTATLIVDKDVTIDFNGYVIYGSKYIVSAPVIRVLADVTVKGGAVDAAEGDGYAFIVGNGTTAGNLTIVDGKYYGDVSVVSVTNGTLTVEDGYFAATEYNGAHEFTLNCIDSAYNNGNAVIVVKGGTFYKFDPANNAAEGAGTNFVAKGYKSVDNSDGTFTVEANMIFEIHLTDANGEAHWLSPLSGNDLAAVLRTAKVWYESLQGTYDFTLKILGDWAVDSTVIVDFPLTIDLNGYTVTGMNIYPVIRVQEGATVTVTGNGSIVNATDYVFVLGSSDQTSAGYLTIENGTFVGQTTVASVTKGILSVNGGTFKCTASEYGSAYMFNCVDANYKNGTAQIVVKGGTFVGFDPMNNAAEGAGTNFVAKGYKSVDNSDGTFTVEANKIFKLHIVDPMTGEPAFIPYIEGNDLASVIATGKNFYANYYEMTLEILGDWAVDSTVIVDYPMTIDLGGHTVSAENTVVGSPVFRILSDVTVKNGAVDGRGGSSCYAFIVGDSTTAGSLTIVDGKYYGDVSVVSVTNGTLTVEDGYFEATEYNGAHEFTLNCIDSAYNNGNAVIVVKGGTFYKFDPEDNAAEGKNTNFVADGYKSVDNGNETYTVKRVITVKFDDATMTYGDELPKFTFTTNFGDFAEDGEMLVVNQPVISGTNVGTYEIKADAYVFMSDKYAFEIIPGTLTIEKAKVTVKFDDATMVHGNELPKFTYTTNFTEIAQDGEMLVVPTPVINVVGAGTYVIDADAYVFMSDNYDVEVIPGTLTVQKAALSVDGVFFTDLASAIPSIKRNSVIKLYDDIEYGKTVVDGSNKFVEFKLSPNLGDLVIDLNGHDLTFHFSATVQFGTTLTIKDSSGVPGTIRNTNGAYPFVINPNTVVNLVDGVNFDCTIQMNCTNKLSGYFQIDGKNVIGETDSLFVAGNSYIRLALKQNYLYVKTIAGTLTLAEDWKTLAGQTVVIGGSTGITVAEGVTLTIDPTTQLTIQGYLNGEGTVVVNTLEHFEQIMATDIKNIEIGSTIVLSEDYVLDLAGKKITSSEGVNPAFRVTDGAKVTVKNADMDTAGYAFILGASDASTDGYLTIENGKFHSVITVVSVTKGKLTVLDGEFSAEPYNGNYAYLFNCIDANYRNGTASIEISGGIFHNWDPEDNAAEGKNTNFVADLHASVEIDENVWKVVDVIDVTVTLDDKTMVIGNAQPEYTYTLSDAALADVIKVTFNAINVTAVGTYDITATVEADSLYNVTVVDATLTVVDAVAQIGSTNFASLRDALASAEDGDTIVILKDHAMDGTDVVNDPVYGYDNLAVLDGKAVTLDFNGHTISVQPDCDANDDNALKNCLESVIFVANGGSLTVTDTVGNGGFYVTKGTNLYSLIYNSKGSTVTVKNGNFYIEETVQNGAVIYADANNTTSIEGGNFTLVNAGSYDNTKPWITNVEGKNSGNFVQVTGGTFNQDPYLNRFTAKDWEVNVPENFAVVDNGNGTWSVVPAVVYIEEDYIPGYKTGYATLADALAAVENGETIVFVKDFSENVTIKQKKDLSFTINGNGKTFGGTITIDGASRSNGEETLTITNVNFLAETEGQSSIITKKSSFAHNVTIDGCTFTGTDTQNVYGITLQHAYDITLKNVTASKLLDLVYGRYAVTGFVAENVTVTETVNGFWFTSVKGASFKNVNVKADNAVVVKNAMSSTMTFEDCSFEAETPVYMWLSTEGVAYSMVFNGTNNMVATNGGSWLFINEAKRAGFKVTLNDTGLDAAGIDSVVAMIGDNVYYNSVAYAVKDAQDGETVVVIADDTSAQEIIADNNVTLDLNGYDVTGNLTVNGNLTIKDSTVDEAAKNYDDAGHLNGTITVADGATLTLYAGIYNQNVDEYCADHYLARDNKNGTWTVCRGVVFNKTYGTSFMTIADAMANAMTTAGKDHIVLLEDHFENIVIVYDNTILDLGTFDLTTNYVIVFKGGNLTGNTYSSTKDHGKLIVAQRDTNVIFDGEGYVNANGYTVLPTWDAEQGCYVFSYFAMTTTGGNRGYKYDVDNDTARVTFKIQSSKSAVQDLLLDGIANHGINIVLTVTCKKDGNAVTQDYVYSDELLKKCFDSTDNLTFQLGNVSSLTDVTFEIKVVSETGAYQSGGVVTLAECQQ